MFRLSVTLTHLNVLASHEQEFKKLGWLQNDHELAVNVNVADLKCVLDLLRPAPHLFSYLAERSRLQRTFAVEGDELDWLGLYLDTCFNMGKTEGEVGGFFITGMSTKVDQYYVALDAGLNPSRPEPRLTKLWQEMLAHPTSRQFEGWLEVAVALLQSASYAEQRRIEREFARICKKVPLVWRQEDHINSVVVTPPDNRSTAIVVHAYPAQLWAKRRETAQAVAGHAFDKPHIERCIVFGRQVPQAATPFSFVYVFGSSDDTKVMNKT